MIHKCEPFDRQAQKISAKNLFLLFLMLSLPIQTSSFAAEIVELQDYTGQSPAIDTLRVGFFKETDEGLSTWAKEYPLYHNFYLHGEECSVQVLENKPEMKYMLWLQEEKAPLMIIIPGTAVSYSNTGPVAFAQMFFKKGFSVATISNAMNWEFMESAATADVPAFPYEDAKDVYNALKKLIAHIEKENPDKIAEKKALLGYSLGALHTLFIADFERNELDEQKKAGFIKYIAVNPPVQLSYSIKQLDSFYEKWRQWAPGQLQRNMNQAANVYFMILNNSIGKNDKLLISNDQAEFIIGYSFRMLLSETIYSLYRRGKDMGAINVQDSWFSKEPVYREIRNFSFDKYIREIVAKSYSAKLGRTITLEEMDEKSSLRQIASTLSECPYIHIFHNKDDFIVSQEDLAWLASVVGESRMTVFNHGGHLGNLDLSAVREKIVQATDDIIIQNLENKKNTASGNHGAASPASMQTESSTN